MKFEVNRLLMLDVVKSVAKIAPSNSPVEVLNGILIESNEDTGEIFMTATNYEVSIQQKIAASVQESGSMLINARLLVSMMSKLAGEFVTLSADRPELLIVSDGNCTYQIYCLPSKSYPKPIMPFPEESVIMTGICSLAKRTTFAVSKDDSAPALQCVQVKLKNNTVHATACDRMRMMLTRDEADAPNEREFLLPGRSLQILASISQDDDVFEVGDIGKDIVFVRGDMIFSIRKLAVGSYIDTAGLLKNLKPIYAALADAGQMKEALNVIDAGASAGGTKEPVNLVLLNGEIIFQCNSDYIQTSMAVSANVTKATPETGFFYDVSALSKLFQVIAGKVKLEIDAKGFMLVKTQTRSEVYFQAPMRAPIKKAKPSKQMKEQEEKQEKEKTKRAKGAENVKEKEVA